MLMLRAKVTGDEDGDDVGNIVLGGGGWERWVTRRGSTWRLDFVCF